MTDNGNKLRFRADGGVVRNHPTKEPVRPEKLGIVIEASESAAKALRDVARLLERITAKIEKCKKLKRRQAEREARRNRRKRK